MSKHTAKTTGRAATTRGWAHHDTNASQTNPTKILLSRHTNVIDAIKTTAAHAAHCRSLVTTAIK